MLAQRLRVAADRRRRAQVQPHRAAGQPEPIVTGAAGGGAADADGEFGEIYMARGLCYKWRDTIGKHARVSRCRPASTTTSGSGPRRSARSRRTASTTTGTGSGTPATATSATRASTKSTSPAGASASPTRPRSAPSAASSCSTTTRRRRTRSPPRYEFDVDGKKKMMTFEVRHWISPHEAGIDEEKPGNTIGNQFYGSKGYLVIDNYNKYYSFLGKDQTAGTDGDRARRALGELHRRRAQPEARGAERGDRGRRAVLQPDAPGQHQLPGRPHAALGCEEDGVHRRCRSQQDADPRLPRAVRRPQAGLSAVALPVEVRTPQGSWAASCISCGCRSAACDRSSGCG